MRYTNRCLPLPYLPLVQRIFLSYGLTCYLYLQQEKYIQLTLHGSAATTATAVTTDYVSSLKAIKGNL